MKTHASMVLVRLGEIALKGLNRRSFEDQLQRNIARRMKHMGSYEVVKRESRMWIIPCGEEAKDPETRDERVQEAMEQVVKVFGVVSASPVIALPKQMDALKEAAAALAQEQFDKGLRTFKVESKRGDKSFPLTSPELSRALGIHVYDHVPGIEVDLHHPDFTIWVEVRDQIYIYTQIVKAHRGLPVGTSAKAMVLLSGGIDSPVAAYMIASRGCPLECIYFHTFPYTSDRAKEKVQDLARLVSAYSGDILLHVVDFTDVQLALRDHSPETMMTLTMRRMMMRIAEGLAEKQGCQSLVTGESLGQVASQTMEALRTTDEVVSLPVLRPLIGLDKDDTIAIARRIGTFETSILPYDDCCTVFVAKHPVTRPKLDLAKKAEKDLDIEALTRMGLSRIETFLVRPHRVDPYVPRAMRQSETKMEETTVEEKA